MKILKAISNNILFFLTLFLLGFIPLYPKLPIIDIKNTWVYVRAEDFIFISVVAVWLILFVTKKISLRTPLTIPILIFWATGAIATIHAVLLIFPNLANVFPNVALLSYLRRIEYMSLFFIAFSGLSLEHKEDHIRNALGKYRTSIPIILASIFLLSAIIFTKPLLYLQKLHVPVPETWINSKVFDMDIRIVIFTLTLSYVLFYASVFRNKIYAVISVMVTTFLFIIFYGIGQRFFPPEFLAYLTMNEEFAKGIGKEITEQNRIASTFAGHYDLAGYLVLMLPIMSSLFFGIKKWSIRIVLLIGMGLGLYVMFLTESRVSFFALLISLLIVLLIQKKKIVLFALPIVVLVLTVLFIQFAPGLTDRFGNTVKEIDILVDAHTGESIGHIEKVPSTRIADKTILRKVYQTRDQLLAVETDESEYKFATESAVVPAFTLPDEILLVSPPNESTGENLPAGTGYTNLSLSPVTKRTGEFFYQVDSKKVASSEATAFMYQGDFLIKNASAYDLSFTTRFQGEWPHALEAFRTNVLFGSGYSSVSLAVDNNYLRILAEVGLIGFIAFFAIFVVAFVYIKSTLPYVESRVVKSLVLGYVAGVVGLMLNATLIDVFEASKIGFSLWIITGIVLAILHFYHTKPLSMAEKFKKVVISPYAITIYLAVATIALFSPMISNFFVGDDFTWLRWAADCKKGFDSLSECPPTGTTISQYFLNSEGFFYRPGTKLYFMLMYSLFWLNQTVYHIVSLLLHFIMAVLAFLVIKRVIKSYRFSVLASFLFLILSGYGEAVFWISSTGHLFNAVFTLLSMLLFSLWEEKRKKIFLVMSILSITLGLLFYEIGVVTPLLVILYSQIGRDEFKFKTLLKNRSYWLLFTPVIFYLILRYTAQSHWLSGDYSYNILKLPFNVIGNAFGYFMVSLFGPIAVSFSHILRTAMREHIMISLILATLMIVITATFYRKLIHKIHKEDKKILTFGILFFLISLLPFLGLGNITSRYSYVASVGVVILLVLFIQKMYHYLTSEGKDIALSVSVVFVSVFALFHIIQIQGLHSDWYEAGKKSERFFISVNSVYSDYWTSAPMKIFFVNVPVRVGEAWVFPNGFVGLEDALWFAFKNPNMQVYKSSSVKEALDRIDGSDYQKVFEFDESGKVIERRKRIIQP